MKDLEKKQNDVIVLYDLYLTLFTNKLLSDTDINYIYSLDSDELDLFVKSIQKKLGGVENEK